MNIVEVNNWSEFREYFSNNHMHSYGLIYRGHADADWLLESTLTRFGKKLSGKFSPETLEGKQLENFRLRILGLRGQNPPKLKDSELWSLGQHYGLSTPLLDWTDSPYIAVYFAFEQALICNSGKRSLFILNRSELSDKLQEMQHFDLEFIQPVNDENPRLIAQSGSFTKLPTLHSLEEWLGKLGLEHYLTKVVIPDKCRNDVLNELRLMNIIGTTIYPDLTGAAITCNMWLEMISINSETAKAEVDRLKKRFE